MAQTGSIGEAFLQCEPCAVNDDCLVLLPKTDASLVDLILAAACLQEEKWRFTYGRKLIPTRIASFRLPSLGDASMQRIQEKMDAIQGVIEESLRIYQPRRES